MSDAIKPHKILSIGEERKLAKVISITCNSVDKELVEMLVDVTERAKRGDVRAFAIAWQDGLSQVNSGFCLGTGSIEHLAYALDWLKHRLVIYNDP